MRSSLVFLNLKFLAAALLAVPCVYGAPMKIRDAATHDQLAKRAQEAAINKPLGNLNPKSIEPDKDPTKHNQPKNLLETSDFLSFGDMTTIIPKGSILVIPKQFQGRTQHLKGRRIVTWPNFYPTNRGWIKTMEVTREQAQGKEPFDEKVAENLAKSTIVVVAVYKNGPISVLPYKDPEAAKEGEEGEENPDAAEGEEKKTPK